MSLCINPSCPKPDHPGNDHSRFCQSCGSDLLLQNRYRIIRLLSDDNGFSKTYEIYELDTPKILKVLKDNFNANPTAVELFQQEATVLTQINHPGIPKVDSSFQFQTRNNLLLHCLVMEKVEGSNLEEWIKSRDYEPISQEQAIAWLKQLVEILHLLHRQPYFHWNIKPSNIIFSPSGQLVLIDFATAREKTSIYLDKLGTEHRIKETVSDGYIPPEQLNGQPVPQSDFFALGRTFVFLLTGQHPLNFYDGDRNVFNWRNHTTVSPMVADFIDWLMARQPSDRPVDTLILSQRLEQLERDLHYLPNLFSLAVIAGLLLALSAKLSRCWLFSWLNSISSAGLRIAIVTIILCSVPGGIAIVTPKVICSLGLSSDSCPSQEPQQIGDVDYFPPEEGTDSQGKTADFEVAVLSREYEWKLGSPYETQSNNEIIKVENLKPILEQQGIQNRLKDTTDIISVGTASCEGSVAAEELRALQRSKSIQLLAKTLFSTNPTVKNYHLLNLGKFTNCANNSNPSSTSYQRSMIIIGVSQKTEGVILDEALYDRLKKNPFGDFKLEDYSLGAQDKFKLSY